MGSDNDKNCIKIIDDKNNNEKKAFFLKAENTNLLMEKIKCLIKIKKDDAFIGNGFFCKIPYPDNLIY